MISLRQLLISNESSSDDGITNQERHQVNARIADASIRESQLQTDQQDTQRGVAVDVIGDATDIVLDMSDKLEGSSLSEEGFSMFKVAFGSVCKSIGMQDQVASTESASIYDTTDRTRYTISKEGVFGFIGKVIKWIVVTILTIIGSVIALIVFVIAKIISLFTGSKSKNVEEKAKKAAKQEPEKVVNVKRSVLRHIAKDYAIDRDKIVDDINDAESVGDIFGLPYIFHRILDREEWEKIPVEIRKVANHIVQNATERSIFGWIWDIKELELVSKLPDYEISLTSVKFEKIPDSDASGDEDIPLHASEIMHIYNRTKYIGLSILKTISAVKSDYEMCKKAIKDLPKKIDPESETAKRDTKYLKLMAQTLMWMKPSKFVGITTKAMMTAYEMLPLITDDSEIERMVGVMTKDHAEILSELDKSDKHKGVDPNDIPDIKE